MSRVTARIITRSIIFVVDAKGVGSGRYISRLSDWTILSAMALIGCKKK